MVTKATSSDSKERNGTIAPLMLLTVDEPLPTGGCEVAREDDVECVICAVKVVPPALVFMPSVDAALVDDTVSTSVMSAVGVVDNVVSDTDVVDVLVVAIVNVVVDIVVVVGKLAR